MISFQTETGSTYHVDDLRQVARRVVAGSNNTVRATPEWRKFLHRSDIFIGLSVTFFWDSATPLLPGSPEGSVPMTETSRVVSLTLRAS